MADFTRELNWWSLRCNWSIACRRCSNYIFILHLTLGFNILCKDNCKPRREIFNFWDLVRLISEILWSIQPQASCQQASYLIPVCSEDTVCRVLLAMVVERYSGWGSWGTGGAWWYCGWLGPGWLRVNVFCGAAGAGGWLFIRWNNVFVIFIL